jgi:hypothetical protein
MASKRTYEGIITPSGWDPSGNVESISLQTIDENEYLIEKNRLEMELRTLIYAKVEVKGKIRQLISGKKALAVREFKPVDSYREDRR